MAAVGLALLTPLGLPALVVPFLCVGGASAGVFAARGMEGVRGDRRRRETELDQRAQLRAAEEYFTLLETGVKKNLLTPAQAQELAQSSAQLKLPPPAPETQRLLEPPQHPADHQDPPA
jgi:hypothetical protein